MRLVGGKPILIINNWGMEIAVSDSGRLDLVHKDRFTRVPLSEPTETLTLPMIPLPGLSVQERIALSVNLIFQPLDQGYEFFSPWTNSYIIGENRSLVDIQGEDIFFITADDNNRNPHIDKLTCYQVVDWDQEKIHCQKHSERPFTFLESLSLDRSWHKRFFVKKGRFYLHNDATLMVFAIHSQRGLRKLGQFERLTRDFKIEGIHVEENDNILLFNNREEELVTQEKLVALDGRVVNRHRRRVPTIYLMKGPTR
jgi:hypothetical protein